MPEKPADRLGYYLPRCLNCILSYITIVRNNGFYILYYYF
jgi:hypothetical protein